MDIFSYCYEKSVAFLRRKIHNISLKGATQEDYEKLERKKTRFELILLSLVVFGIEICYAAETAFVTPILQKIGVPVQFMSMVWGLSPIVGFFACPILGSLSDVCTSKLGRRRPFIVVYSMGILVGLLLTGYGHKIGVFVSNANAFIVIVTILGVVLLDFSCDACQSPARAYLIDISRENNDHSLGLSMFTVMAGAGGAIGYILGGIPWSQISPHVNTVTFNELAANNLTDIADNESIAQSDLAHSHKQILFTFVAVIYVVCALISITSFKEIPLNNSSTCASNSYEQFSDEQQQTHFVSTFELNSAPYAAVKTNHHTNMNKNKSSFDHLETLKYYLQSILKMPTSLRWLCATHGLCWMSLLCYSLYFTDFVGEEIYGGLPTNENRDLHKLYDDGVRAGSLFMSFYSISCSVFSFCLQKFILRFKTKYVYIFSQLVYSLGMLVLALSKNIFIAGLTSFTAGIMYSALFTIPFILVANYHSQESFELLENDHLAMAYESQDDSISVNSYTNNSGSSVSKRGLGTDLSLMSSMVFVAQFNLSFLLGPLMKYIGSKSVVIYLSSLCSFLAALTSTRLLYLD